VAAFGAHAPRMADTAAGPGTGLPARQGACRQVAPTALVEDVDYRAVRGLDRPLFQKLVTGSWIDAHDNLAIRAGLPLAESLALARGDGRYASISRTLGDVPLLILDDCGLEPLDAQARHDLLEILEQRYGRRSTIVTSQFLVEDWHAVIGHPTYADAILDRLFHNAHRLNLTGDSLRKATRKPSIKVDLAVCRIGIPVGLDYCESVYDEFHRIQPRSSVSSASRLEGMSAGRRSGTFCGSGD
jgi:hypothetical protein